MCDYIVVKILVSQPRNSELVQPLDKNIVKILVISIKKQMEESYVYQSYEYCYMRLLETVIPIIGQDADKDDLNYLVLEKDRYSCTSITTIKTKIRNDIEEHLKKTSYYWKCKDGCTYIYSKECPDKCKICGNSVMYRFCPICCEFFPILNSEGLENHSYKEEGHSKKMISNMKNVDNNMLKTDKSTIQNNHMMLYFCIQFKNINVCQASLVRGYTIQYLKDLCDYFVKKKCNISDDGILKNMEVYSIRKNKFCKSDDLISEYFETGDLIFFSNPIINID
jgi:hypothetical protein